MTNQTRRKFLGGCTSASLAGAGSGSRLPAAFTDRCAKGSPAQARHAGDAQERDQGARLPREAQADDGSWITGGGRRIRSP